MAGQESWEMEGKNIVVDWFGKPPSNPRVEGGVGFFLFGSVW